MECDICERAIEVGEEFVTVPISDGEACACMECLERMFNEAVTEEKARRFH